MIAYILVCLTPTFATLLFPNVDRNCTQRKRYLLFCFTIMLAFLGLRSQYVGNPDTENYYNVMKYAINCDSWKTLYNAKGDFEHGFLVFLYCLSRVFKNPQWLIFTSSLISLISVFFIIWKYSKSDCISLTIYIALGMMTFQAQAMRQALAMSICLFAFPFAQRRRIIPFTLLVLLAASFHQTAIVFFVIYVLCGMHFSVFKTILILLGCVIVVFFADNIVSYANVLFMRNYVNVISSGGYVMSAFYIIVILVALLWDKHLNIEPSEDETMPKRNFFHIKFKRLVLVRKDYSIGRDSSFLYIAIVACLCYLIRYFASQAAERISFYFTFSHLVLLPNALSDIPNGNKKRQIIIITTLSVALFIYRLFDSDLIPYYFFWK